MHGSTMTKRKKADQADLAGRVLRAVRKAERHAGDGTQLSGTGQTILKHRQAPIARLVDSEKIGPEEIQAAQEIEQAFFAIDTRGRLCGMTLDRVDGGRHSDLPWPATVAKAVVNYQRWANHWSSRRKAYGDPMLEVVVAAVIDERPIKEIAMDVGRRHTTVELGLASGLRHYAAWAGFASGQMAALWLDAAESVFMPGNTRLMDAVRRARVEV